MSPFLAEPFLAEPFLAEPFLAEPAGDTLVLPPKIPPRNGEFFGDFFADPFGLLLMVCTVRPLISAGSQSSPAPSWFALASFLKTWQRFLNCCRTVGAFWSQNSDTETHG
jgi:hypothetical protein